ncbi:MAG: hypothetical protein NC228_04880, partial [[Eubacterium] siraeum]|nr:hypothetical protein [[Eubacterium] siraeum]
MTSKRFLSVSYKAFVPLLAMALITSCSNTDRPVSETSAEESPFSSEEITAAPVHTTKTEATDPDIPAETGIRIEIEGDPREFILIGTPHSQDKFIDFSYEGLYEQVCKNYTVDSWWDKENHQMMYGTYPYQEKNDAFFDSLGVPEIKELYFRASALWNCFNDTEDITDIYYTCKPFGEDDQAKLSASHPAAEGINSTYWETGIRSDSFLNAFYDVYTEEAVEEMVKKYPWYVFYNGEIWTQGLSGVIGPAVGAELELVSQTDTEIEFRSVVYQDLPNNTTHYRGEGEPQVYKFNNKFVKTEKGWRAVEIATKSGTSL